MSQFKSLFGLLNKFNVKDIEILKESKINYLSSESVYELLDCLAEYVDLIALLSTLT